MFDECLNPSSKERNKLKEEQVLLMFQPNTQTEDIFIQEKERHDRYSCLSDKRRHLWMVTTDSITVHLSEGLVSIQTAEMWLQGISINIRFNKPFRIV